MSAPDTSARLGLDRVVRRPVEPAAAVAANRRWWDLDADGYQAEHGDFLGPVRFIWGPEGLDEAQVGLLGEVAGRTVLEVGCGAAQCARWLVTQGACAIGLDLSGRQLRHARRQDAETGVGVPVVQADARALPIASAAVDLACSAFGALPFLAEVGTVFREVARVLRPGGKWVFSVTHPIRWCFPDDPGPAGLTVTGSYFDRRPYTELDARGRPVYVEYHRTVGDWVGELVGAGLHLDGIIEPEWPADHDRSWGQWSPLRGRVLPGTVIFRTHRPA